MIDRCQNFCHHRFHLDDLGRTMVSTLQIIQVRPWGVKTYGDLGIPKFRKPPYWYSNIFYKAQQLDATGLRCQNYWVYVCLTCPKSFFVLQNQHRSSHEAIKTWWHGSPYLSTLDFKESDLWCFPKMQVLQGRFEKREGQVVLGQKR